MKQLQPEDVEGWLTAYGWKFESCADGHWRTGFTGERRYFPLHIRMTSTCVSFEVTPLVESMMDGPLSPGAARELLELNGRMQMAKIGLTETGELALACQVLTAGLDFEAFSRILGILGYYADAMAPELLSRVAGSRSDGRPLLLC